MRIYTLLTAALLASLASAADTLPPLPPFPAIPAAQPVDSVPMADSRSAPEVGCPQHVRLLTDAENYSPCPVAFTPATAEDSRVPVE